VLEEVGLGAVFRRVLLAVDLVKAGLVGSLLAAHLKDSKLRKRGLDFVYIDIFLYVVDQLGFV